MYEWWHDFLYDSNTFGSTIWLLFCLLLISGLAYYMWRDFK